MITVEIYGALACITRTPSLLRRLLFRAKTVERYADRVISITGGFVWCYSDTQKRVEPDVLRAIEAEVRRTRRPRSRAVEPPG